MTRYAQQLWLLLIIIFLPGLGITETYYVSTLGNDSNPGSIANPWNTLTNASKKVVAGDTVVIMPGHYAGAIRPRKSGTTDKPIIYKAEQRGTVVLTGATNEDGTAFAIHLERVGFIILTGLVVEPINENSRWFYADSTNNITIKDLRMINARAKTPFIVRFSRQIKLLESELSGHVPNDREIGNMAVFENSHHILIAGCVFSKAGHSPLQFLPPNSNSNVAIRGNVFHPEWGRNLELFNVENVLVEQNVITHGYDGGRSADPQMKIFSKRGIFRNNIIARNWGIAVNANTYIDSLVLRNLRIYNNIFADNYGPAIQFNGELDRTHDVIFKNNVFTKNDSYGENSQIRTTHSARRDTTFRNNIIDGSIWLDGIERSKKVINAQHEFDKIPYFSGNFVTAPMMDNIDYNYIIKGDSNLIDRGCFLARAIGDGKGIAVPVNDPYPFYDGFGIEGEFGDTVRIGDAANTARIVFIDLNEKRLHLDRPLSWKIGAPIGLPWVGDKPDIGVIEFNGDNHRPEVIIEKRGSGSDSIYSFSVNLKGIVPKDIIWHLGDGSVQRNILRIKKSYSQPGNYPIRLRITDVKGDNYYVAAFISNETEVCCPTNLVNSSFEDNDREWWWRWKVYRPKPVSFERAWTDKEHGYSLHVYASSNGSHLTAQVNPVGWKIDQYPSIRFNYKISTGLPLKVIIYGFEVPDSERSFCVADTAEKTMLTCAGFVKLLADNEWHECVISAIWIKNKFPKVNILKGFRIAAKDPGRVKSGEGYWIDDFKISAEK